MTYNIFIALPLLAIEYGLFQLFRPATYFWSVLLSVVLLVLLIVTGSKESKVNLKNSLLIQPLIAVVAYSDLVVLTQSWKTTEAELAPRTEAIYQELGGLCIAMIISFVIRLEKFFKLFNRDSYAIGAVSLAMVLVVIITLIQALMGNEVIGLLTIPYIISTLIRSLLSSEFGKKITIPPLVLSYSIHCFLLSADWRPIGRGDVTGLVAVVGLLSVLQVYSLTYLCQQNSVFFPSLLNIGMKLILKRQDGISDTMMGLVLMIASFFHWYLQIQLEVERAVEGEVIVETNPLLTDSPQVIYQTDRNALPSALAVNDCEK